MVGSEVRVLLAVIPCNAVDMYRRFEGTCFLDLYGEVKREATDSLETLVPSTKRPRRSYFLPRITVQFVLHVSVVFEAGNLCYQPVSFSTWRIQSLIPLKHSTKETYHHQPWWSLRPIWSWATLWRHEDVDLSRRYWEPVGYFEAATCELRRGQEDGDHGTPRCV